MPSLSREELGQIIDRGESVFVRDKAGGLRIVNTRDGLPSEADLAKASGDPAKKAAARQAIDDQIAALTAARDGLDAAPAEPEPVKAPAPTAEPKADEPKPKGK